MDIINTRNEHLKNKHTSAQILPIMILFGLLLSGSLINNLPGQTDVSLVNLTNDFVNFCLSPSLSPSPSPTTITPPPLLLLPTLQLPLLKQNQISVLPYNLSFEIQQNIVSNETAGKGNLNYNSSMEHTAFISFLVVVFTLILPLISNFVKQSHPFPLNFMDSNTILLLYNHLAGQILSFSSGEILRHFLVFPQFENFVNVCNLTDLQCQHYKNKLITTDILCSAQIDSKNIFDTLHSMPNVVLVMVGAASVNLATNYISPVLANTISNTAPAVNVIKYRKINYFLTTQYFKFVILIVYMFIVFIYVWDLLQNYYHQQLTEIFLSLIQGAFLQTSVNYALKNKNENFMSFLFAK